MPTTTTVRQTTVVTQPGSTTFSSISVQRGFISTVTGMLTIVELVLGIITFSLAVSYLDTRSTLFLVLVSFTYWIITFMILASALLSASGTVLPTTQFYLTFHAFGFLFYTCGGLSCAVQAFWAANIASGVMGLLAGICHLVHVVFAYKKKI
ncbi:uncharacterized protein LOC135399776 [Ornithodoros turicata]